MTNRKWASNMPKRVVSAQNVEQLIAPKGARDSKEAMFNSKGQVNAYDKKDVFAQQEKFAAIRDGSSESDLKIASLYNDEQKSKIFAAAVGNNSEWMKFGQEGMVPLILKELDYKGFIRNVFFTHNVAQGQIIKYEKDIDVTALIIADNGETIESRVVGDRVFPGEFNVTAFPTISVKEVAVRDFDAVERAKDKAAQQIMLQEDRNGLRLLYQGASIDNTVQNIAGAVNKSVIENLTASVESWGLVCNKVLMNRKEFGDLRQAVNTNDYDPVTAREVWLNGMFGQFWGYNILVAAGKSETRLSIPEGMLFAVTEPRFVGGMGIRVELEAHPADRFPVKDPSYGWMFVEVISQALVNPRAVSMAMKPGTVVPAWMSA